MNRLTKAVILGTVAIATLLTSMEFASARDRYWRDRHHGHFGERAVTAGVLGLAAGVIVGSALSEPDVVYSERPVYRPRRVVVEEAPVYAEPEYLGPVDEYVEPRDDAYVRPRAYRHTTTVAQGAIEPWTAQWRSYCSQRFSSFNATTGTYTGYDGRSHFCTGG